MRHWPESLSCASWLVYATRATDERSARVKTLIVNIKSDRVDARSGVPIVQLVVQHAAARLGAAAAETFSAGPMLVPVPGSGLTKPNTVWPAYRVCEELIRHGLGADIWPVLTRTTAVPKSAGSSERPTMAKHVESLTVQKRLTPPSRLLLVDDVVTTGTTMMACAIALAEAFPGVPIAGFALARVLSTGNPEAVLDLRVERIRIAGTRCTRGDA